MILQLKTSDVTRKWIILTFSAFLIGLADFASLEYCEDETFSPSCSADEVVVINEATYGRMNTGKCIPAEYSFSLGCSATVMNFMDLQCSGRRSCSVPVRDLIANGLGNCPSALRSYLQVSFTCVKVVTPTEARCRGTSPVLIPNISTEGYISSYVSQQTGCGNTDTPWLLKVDVGQRINITLIDFTSGQSTATSTADSHVCVVYATIKDGNGMLSQTVCGGTGKRVQPVFTSASNSIEIRLVGKLQQSKSEGYFLMKYAVEGCSDPDLPAGTWLKRDSQGALVGCKTGPQTTWLLICVRGAWLGQMATCSPTSISSRDGEQTINIAASQSQIDEFVTRDIALILISGIAVCVAVAIFILGVLCIRRKFMKTKNRSPMNNDYPSYRPRDYTLPMPPAFCEAYPNMANDRPSTLKTGIAPMGLYPYSDTSSTYSANPRMSYKDHVYESPKFERVNGDVALRDDTVFLQHNRYFEADPRHYGRGFNILLMIAIFCKIMLNSN